MEHCKDSYIKSPRSITVAATYEWYETRACDWEKFLCLFWVGGHVGAVVVYEAEWLNMEFQLWLL